jgi:peptide/nickel transport system substrate-binding protein
VLAGLALAGLAVGLVACGGAGSGPGEATDSSVTTDTAPPWVSGLGGSITVGIEQQPTGCNPNSSTGDTWADDFVLEPVLPSAFVVSPGSVPIYDSAVITQAEVVSTSPQTVVYTINPRAVWSDGTPVTAADFIYAWQEQRGPDSDAVTPTAEPAGAGSAAAGAPGPAAGGQAVTDVDDMASTLGYRQIKSVTGSHGGRTVTVVFKTPFADWKELFGDLLPAHVMQKDGWNPACTTVDPRIDLSAGPFEIARVTSPDRITLARNPRWWGQKADLSQIVVRVAASATALAGWLARGTAQVVEPSSFDESFLERVTERPDMDSANDISTTFLQLEFSTTAQVTADVRVRQALAYAIDRRALVSQLVGWDTTSIFPAASHIYAQGQGSYPGPLPPTVEGAVQPGAGASTTPATPTPARPFPLGAKPAETARLLAAAGFSQDAAGAWVGGDGKPLTVRVAVDEADAWAASAGAAVIAQLESQGIAVTTVDEAGATAAGEDLANGVVDAAVLPFAATPYPTQAIAWYTPLLGPAGTEGSQDWSNLDDPTLNHLLETASQQLNPVTAAPLYAQADALLWKEMVALPLFAEPTGLAWSNETAGVGPNPSGPGLLWFPEGWAHLVPPTSTDTAPS